MKVAIVHEWFVNYMGSEKCVESFNNIFKDADNFSLIDFLNETDRNKILKGKKATTSFIQNLPFAKSKYRSYLPFFPLAIEQLNVSGYDVVLSSSHAVAKGVLTDAKQLHITYCHTPIRYVWDLYFQYLKDSKLEKGLKAALAKYILHKIRLWDATTSNRVDYYLANSNFVAKRIKKTYGKNADVIYPPVDIGLFDATSDKDDYYLAIARFVPYKKMDLIVEAFSKMPDKKLLVIGDGPDEEKIKSLSTQNIELLGYQDFKNLKQYLEKAKAFVFAAEEDFGITNVEAQAAGTPVIAFGVGGSAETVIHNETGILYKEQTVNSLIDAVNLFEKNQNKFDSIKIRKHSEKFSRQRFEDEIRAFVEEKYNEFKG